MVTTEEVKQLGGKVKVEGTLTGEVTSKEEPRNVNMKSGGTINVCDAKLKDEAGEIKLTLWAEDIDKVRVGDTVSITDGFTNSFKDEVSIAKGRSGKMEVNPA